MLELHIGNKNYSSWSMRPWVLLRQAGIPFTEVMHRFDSFDADSGFKRTISAVSPVGKVPVLVDGDLAVWDTLAIAEYLAEQYPQHLLWPEDRAARARARSISAEMHSGFAALRGACPMNIEARLPETGALLWRDRAAVRDDVSRLEQMWGSLLQQYGGSMLFGEFSVVDAYYAPVCSRLKTYALPIPAEIDAYVERVHQLPAVREWVQAALAEQDFVAMDEPYRAER